MKRNAFGQTIHTYITICAVAIASISLFIGTTVTAVAAANDTTESVASGSNQSSDNTAPSGVSSITQELHVTAKVVPMRRVIVDTQGQIVQIMSNTTAAIPPTIFVGSDVPQNQIALSPKIAADYARLLPANAGIGVLYDRTVSSARSPRNQRFVAIFGSVSFDRK